jgi:hypothetical protein
MTSFIENIKTFFSGTNKTAIIYVAAVFVIAIVVMVVNISKRKKTATSYLSQYPDAAKVYIRAKAMAGDALQVATVNGESPALFSEGVRTGFYAKPGTVTVQLNFTHTRAGVMYRTVSKSTGFVEKTIVVEPNGLYTLSFDKDTSEFTLEEGSK